MPLSDVETNQNDDLADQTDTFPIVAIGASSGGLEAMKELLEDLPSDTGMAYVYIQHLDPTHKSLLSSILARSTTMKVLEVKDLLKLNPNHLYIIPPNKDMTLIDGVFHLNPRKAKPSVHLPVNSFFASLAEKHKEDSVGIVLSGNASDGSFGLKMIKLAGGITMAQDDSAKFKSMPHSAISEGVVDMVLSPKQMALELKRISRRLIEEYVPHTGSNTEMETWQAEEDLQPIIQLLKSSTGVDFTHYKANTIKRRIVRRMLLYKMESLRDYYSYLKDHPQEITSLYEDLLIHVTSFFRDLPTMEYLKKSLIPKMLKAKQGGEPIRVWIPACSTGEEAYSLAMTFLDVLGDQAVHVPLQLFATDLSDTAIAKARIGLYSTNDLGNVPPKMRQRFFTKLDGSYRISKIIRDLCVFAPHNIFKDPPFSKMDLISCCNLLIYLDPILQKKVIATFHYALNDMGFLVLGKSESVGSYPQLFLQIEKKYKVFTRKKDSATNVLLDINHRLPAKERKELLSKQKSPLKNTTPEMGLEKIVDNILLNEYVPACMVVNQDLEILQFRGATSLFMEPSRGKASFHLMKMIHSDLAFEVRSAVYKSLKSGEITKKSGLLLKSKDIAYQVSIEVAPLPAQGDEKLFLLIFVEKELPPLEESASKTKAKKDSPLYRLQEELANLKDDMRSIVEEHQVSVEELQSANEEIVSSNEELQSINEELETSKEEVESTNEELMTINSEMQVRNEQLSESYDYAQAVIDTIREAVIILDHDFRVKSANGAFYRIFKTKESETEGVLFYELGNGQWNLQPLRELLENVIPRNVTLNGFEITHIFPNVGEKTVLLSARRIIQKMHRRQLIIMAIEDITDHRHAGKIIAEREAWFRNLADHAPVMIWVSGEDQCRTFLNKTFLEFTGRPVEKELGEGWKDRIHAEDLPGFERITTEAQSMRHSFSVQYRLLRHDGAYRWMLDYGKPIYTATNEFRGYLGSCTEIHDNKIIQEELEVEVSKRTRDIQEINKELQRSNKDLEQYAYVASHDLQEPLRKILTFSDRLEEIKDSFPESSFKYIQKISAASQRMIKLIDDLLNFSKLSKDNQTFEIIDLNLVLKNELNDFELIIQEKNATIQIGDMPAIFGIGVQIEQLVHNLFSNAFKFSRKDVPLVIEVSSRKLPAEEAARYSDIEAEKQYYELIFRDNGIGFNPAFADQIFTIFQRLNDNTHYPGTGIGLALCRKIAEYHHGFIYANSKPGHGAAFHVILPGVE